MKYLSILKALPLIWLSIFIGCSFDAQRDNPLDPDANGGNSYASLGGKVTRVNTNIGIEGVSIFLNPGSMGTLSGVDGDYSFQNLSAGNYNITLQHPDYKEVSSAISLSSGQSLEKNFQMNAFPVFDSISVTSQKIVYDYMGGIYDAFVYLYAKIHDIDGSSDLDNCQLLSFWEGNIDTLLANSNFVFNTILDSSEFPNNDIYNILGIMFNFRIIDKYGDSISSTPAQLRRIISYTMKPFSPDLTTPVLTGNPQFTWEIPDSSLIFDYRYRLKVFYSLSDSLRYEKVLYDSSQEITIVPILNEVSYSLQDDTLEENYYYWTIQLEDLYGDFTLSDDLEFYIQ
jgi:hypothetical protein